MNKLQIIGFDNVYGITQDSETENYMVVLTCEKFSELNKTIGSYKVYGITQDPETEKYMVVLTFSELNKTIGSYKVYGITQDPETEKYMVVLTYPKSIESKFIMNKLQIIGFDNKVYGITQDPETQNYMLVLKDICEKCKKTTQLLSHNTYQISKTLEWISYDKFYNIKCTTKVCADLQLQNFSDKLYRANWIDGYINIWDDKNQNWKRKNQDMIVTLRSFNSSENVLLKFINEFIGFHEVYGITKDPETKNYIVAYSEECKKYKHVCNALHFQQNFNNWTSEFMNEITSHCKVNLGRCIVKLYGITQDPETENYAMVLDFAEDGDLRNYLNKNHNKLYLNDKINYLLSIARGLADIHKNELIHRDLHIGNILRCLDSNPLTRPEAEEIKKILNQWSNELFNKLKNHEIQIQIREAENINKNLAVSSAPSTSLGLSYKSRSEDIYTSRLLNFNNLPEPKNTVDYYDNQNDDIISMESSVSLSLQIDISQLNI
ncbi:kinase-like domain-containing protein [Rhizophagus irregularis DAOM 181602=DAOM 197198]|nr:kinase-like domain-containing protein [Rhizophagus irregularis DAOM 181602=DAOM 197198]